MSGSADAVCVGGWSCRGLAAGHAGHHQLAYSEALLQFSTCFSCIGLDSARQTCEIGALLHVCYAFPMGRMMHFVCNLYAFVVHTNLQIR